MIIWQQSRQDSALHADGGEHGLEVLVTSGSMNVHNSLLFFLLCPLPLPMRAAAIRQDVK